jgi:cytochrome P450
MSVPASKLPPGPRMPNSVQTLGWALRPMPFMERCRERYGDVFTLRIRNENTWVFLADPEDVKRVFTGSSEVLRAGEANAILEPVVGSRSVLLLDGPEHMQQRKLMLPSFHGERMQGYEQLMTDITRADIERWPLGEPFALMPRMQAITLEVVMRAVFGVNEAAGLEHLRELLRGTIQWLTNPRLLAMLALLGPVRLMRNRRFRAMMDPVDQAVLEEIRRRRLEPDLAEREDILSLLVQARYEDGSPDGSGQARPGSGQTGPGSEQTSHGSGQAGMSDEELRDELMTLLVAGHETTATSLSWAFERLLRHPDKLERLRAEAAAGESEEYLDAVVKETLRLRPVLPIVVRKLSEPMELGGHTVPAGVAVAPCIHLVHRREDIYPNARAFEPERFLERPAGTYTWIPFGGGVRRCLGASFAQLEMKRVLQTVLSEVRLRAAEPSSERVVRRSITLNPQHGARVVVVSRNPKPAREQSLVGAGI